MQFTLLDVQFTLLNVKFPIVAIAVSTSGFSLKLKFNVKEFLVQLNFTLFSFDSYRKLYCKFHLRMRDSVNFTYT